MIISDLKHVELTEETMIEGGAAIAIGDALAGAESLFGDASTSSFTNTYAYSGLFYSVATSQSGSVSVAV
ncbi:MAG: hypothetical protein F6K09_26395 [Merismopedia sp. SIO2A8]|nr:hypothetical protein [Merismopedia sp. SIO2A8]